MLKSEEVRQGNQHTGTVEKNESNRQKKRMQGKTRGRYEWEFWTEAAQEKEVTKGPGFHSQKTNEWNVLGRGWNNCTREDINQSTGMWYEGKRINITTQKIKWKQENNTVYLKHKDFRIHWITNTMLLRIIPFKTPSQAEKTDVKKVLHALLESKHYNLKNISPNFQDLFATHETTIKIWHKDLPFPTVSCLTDEPTQCKRPLCDTFHIYGMQATCSAKGILMQARTQTNRNLTLFIQNVKLPWHLGTRLFQRSVKKMSLEEMAFPVGVWLRISAAFQKAPGLIFFFFF